MVNNDWKTGLAIALMILAFIVPIVTMEILSEEPSDYSECINKCPSTTLTHKFSNLECPKLCSELLNCEFSPEGKVEE